MTITFELTPELEARLHQEAMDHNLEAVQRILAEAATPAALALLRAATAESEEDEVLESFRSFRTRMAQATAHLSDSEVAAEVAAARTELPG